MRRELVALALPVLAAACAAAAPQLKGAPADSYLTSSTYRRAELEASLVNPDNGYSRLRLAHYEAAGLDSWGSLTEWNPQTAPVLATELDAPGGARLDVPLGADAHARAITKEASSGEAAALRALGEDAFFHYPVQLVPSAKLALGSRASAEKYGLWIDAQQGIGGLVRAELADGSHAFAMTCATCHVGVRDGALTVGVSSERFDLGRMLVDALPESDPTDGTNLLAWGPGRLDVTTTAGIEPVRIPDLRPVRFLTHLHHDGTVAQRGLATLAIRLETLIITSNGRTVRPPREVALGLATYLWSMGEAMRERATETDAERRGMAYFNGECARCHAPKGFTGPPVPLDEVGTDPALGRSPDRTTGKYRVPSLRGVSTRGPLLHDATLPSLDALFDPARTSTDYKGALHGVKGVGGHTFGLALDAASRADLLAYLRTL